MRPSVESLERRDLLATLIDLNASTHSYSGNPSEMVDLNGTLIFAANKPVTVGAAPDPSANMELWRSDGTEAGTNLLLDIRPNNGSNIGSNPQELTRVGDVVYFAADDGYSGRDLWRTDGTPAGTYRVKDIPGGVFGAHRLTVAGSKLFFVADDGFGLELWVSDGTAGGTLRVSDINPGSGNSSPTALTAIGETVYFAAYESAGTYPTLWKSDGTTAGTSRVPRDASNTPIYLSTILYNDLFDLEAVGNTLYFTGAVSGAGRELWKTDGTLAGTMQVKDIATGSASANPSELTALDNHVVFRANDGTGSKLWASDGTSDGTIPLGSFSPGFLVASGSTVYTLAANGTGGTDLWKSDGTPAGTARVAATHSSAAHTSMTGVTAADGSFVFSVSSLGDFWRTDGTETGTYRLGAASGLVSAGGSFALSGGKTFFKGNGGTGYELWTTDGTDAGTTLLKEIAPGSPGSNPQHFVELNGNYYFSTYDSWERALWQTDGTEAGTTRVKSFNQYFMDIGRVGENLYLSTGDYNSGRELWRSDGTAENTYLVKDIRPGSGSSDPQGLTDLSGVLYFSADDGNGREPWRSDGTSAGTYRIADIRPGAGSSFAGNFTPFNGAVYFLANDGTNGTELWRTDGTEAGTVRITTIAPTTVGYLTAYGGALYFWSHEGSSQTYKLWRSDGTTEGTVQVTDLTTDSAPPTQPIVVAGGLLYLRSWNGEIWRTDGTPEGTIKLLANVSNRQWWNVTVVGPEVYVASNSTNPSNRSAELWKTDGTLEGTQRVHAFTDNSAIFGQVVAGANGVYFGVSLTPSVNQVIGEVWRTDGTPEGTSRVEVLGNGGAGDFISRPLISGRYVVARDDGVNGEELWSIQLESADPSGLVLSNALVEENSAIGTAVGTLSAGSGSGVVYSLVPGDGAADNAHFSIDGNVLRTGAVFDFESKPLYSVRVRAMDSDGASLESAFTINIISVNEAPVARPDQVVVGESDPYMAVDVLANDTDPDQEDLLLRVQSFTNAANGSVVDFGGDGRLLHYRPNLGFVGTDSFTYTVRDFDGLTSTTTVTVTVTSNTIVVPVADPLAMPGDLQVAINTATAGSEPVDVTINVNSTNISQVIDAIQQVYANEQVSIVLYTNSGEYAGLHIAAPANVRVILDGQNGQVTLAGASPALTVESGEVEVRNMILTNATDAPTILVTGGRLVLRDSMVHETTAGNQAAVRVTGGSADLGTSAAPGNNVLNINGEGLFTDDTGNGSIIAVGNSYQIDGVAREALQVTSVIVNGGEAQRSMITSLLVTFNRALSSNVDLVDVFKLVRRDGAAITGFSTSLSPDRTQVELLFSSALSDGIYDLTVEAEVPADSDGAAMAADHLFAFHRLFGDGDGDGDVDGIDINLLRGTYGKTAGMAGYLWYFDGDRDDDVDRLDYMAVNANYRKKLVY